MDNTIEHLKKEIKRIRLERKLANQRYEALIQKKENVLEQQRHRKKQMKSSFSSIRHYSPYIGSNTINAPTSVIVLQSKYLAQMHQTCVMLKQFTLLEDHASKLVANLRSDRLAFLEEHALLLVQIVESISQIKTEQELLRNSCQSRIEEQAKALEQMRDRGTPPKAQTTNTMKVQTRQPSPHSVVGVLGEETVAKIKMAEGGNTKEIFNSSTMNEITAQ